MVTKISELPVGLVTDSDAVFAGVRPSLPTRKYDLNTMRSVVINTYIATHTLLTTEDVLLCDATTVAFAINLPTAATFPKKLIRIKKIDSSANILTIDGFGAETIGGDLTKILNTSEDALAIVSDGTNWIVLEDSTNLATNEVVINSEADFPAAVAGVITLETGKRYAMNAVVVTGNRFVIPTGAFITITSVELGYALVYTGTGAMFTGSDFGVFLTTQIIFQAPAGAFFDLDNGGSFFSLDTIWQSAASGGTIRNDNFLADLCQFIDLGDGIVSSDRTDLVPRTQIAFNFTAFFGWKNNAATMCDISGNILSVLFQHCSAVPNSNETIFNFDSSLESNNVPIGINAFQINYVLGGVAFTPTSLKGEYVRSVFNAISGISDSTSSSQAAFENNGLTTTINTINVPEPINALWNGQLFERMTFQDVFTADNTTDTLTASFNHGLLNNDRVTVAPGNGATLPTGLNNITNYFVVNVAATTFQLSLTSGGGAVDFTDNGTGTLYYRHTSGVNAMSWVIYLGLEDIKLNIQAHATIANGGGGTTTFGTRLSKTDISFTETTDQFLKGSSVDVAPGTPFASDISSLVQLSTGEGIRMQAENRQNTDNIDVTDASFTFLKV